MYKINDKVVLVTNDFNKFGETAVVTGIDYDYPDDLQIKFESDGREVTVTSKDIKLAVETKIKIKYFDKEIDKLAEFCNGDWIDLRSRVTVEYKAGDTVKLPLNVAMELPKGYEAVINPRSSTYKHYGLLLVNSQGVIDNSYNGDNDEWMFVGYATRDGKVDKNDRVCQFRIQKNQPKIIFDEVDHLGNEDRGGFGTSGKA